MADLAIDLCCGLGGWTAGLLATGFRVVGFDVTQPKSYPAGAQFVQQDVLTLDGAQFRGRAALIVASPPCTEFSQMWHFAKHRRPDPEGGMALVRQCFAIARAAQCPFILENVRGAVEFIEPEFGPVSWRVGPYYFWGLCPVLRPHGVFTKRIWNTNRDRSGARRWHRDGRARTYERSPAERSRIPIQIAHAVGRAVADGTFWFDRADREAAVG